MLKKNKLEEKLERRKLLKAAAAGACGLSLAAILESRQLLKASGLNSSPGAKKGFLRPVRSRWFEQLKDNQVKCRLCPKKCKLAEGQRAPCRVRENRHGYGYTLTYGNPALVQEDPIERKPFFHVLPGTRALSVSTAGCNLECKFCEVWDMALANPEEVFNYDLAPKKVVEHALVSKVASLSYAFGEPVVFYEYMEKIAGCAKKEGLLNLMHSAGFISPEPLKELSKRIDAANIDLKSFDPAFYRDVVGGRLEPVLETLKLLRGRGVHIEITNILIPTLNDDLKIIENMCKWIIKELGPDTPLHFARFYPLYKLSSLPRTPVSTLDRARQTAMDLGLKYVYVARVTGHQGENTFCPGCGKKIIDRIGFMIDRIEVKKGKCNFCGTSISGIWKKS